ncbi:hypothetical protein TTRE_0000229501 [Trichuris trichiura]|uniref:Uncharacterized protein n=1 Tax=Trichuris trichiura TaxID=36087 RepID=A0A077Z1Q5_TRITR|nr:hypothetical protein TTRE_0000229501 [Trichuris trichiura]
MLPLHGDLYTSPSYGHVYAPPPPLRQNHYRGPPASTPINGPIITELTPSEYGSTVTDVRCSSLEKEQQQCYVRRLGHQRFYSPEQHSESPRATKARSWREVNDDVAARVTAASTDSPPIIPKRDYDEPTSYADKIRDESGQKCKRAMKSEPKESTPYVTCNGAATNTAVQLYKSPNRNNGELVAMQNGESAPFFHLTVGQPPFAVDGMPFPPMFPYFLLPPPMLPPPPPPPLPPPPPVPPIVVGSPMDMEVVSYNEAQRQHQMSKKCPTTIGCFGDANMFPPPKFLPDPLCRQPSAPYMVNGFAKPTNGRYHYDPSMVGACLPIKEKRKEKSDPCLLFCCKDFTQLVWLIVGIILIGLVIGLILGLTLV